MNSYLIKAYNASGTVGFAKGAGTKAEVLAFASTLRDWFAERSGWTGADIRIMVDDSTLAFHIDSEAKLNAALAKIAAQHTHGEYVGQQTADPLSSAAQAHNEGAGTMERNKLQEFFNGGASRSFCLVGKGKSAHLSLGNDEPLCGRPMLEGSMYISAMDASALDICKPCWARMEKIANAEAEAHTNEGGATMANLKLSEVRGDVLIGSVPGGAAIHALKPETDDRGWFVPMCPTRTKNPIQAWGPAMEQKPGLELCAGCSKVVPTGDVTVTEEPVSVPGLDLTVTQKVITPDATSIVSVELHQEDDHMVKRWERCSLDSMEEFTADARRILLDMSELSTRTLDAADWNELYEWFTRDKGESMPAKKKAAPAKPDVDALISDVHGFVDQIKGADAKMVEVYAKDAEDIIRTLPTDKRGTLRKAIGDAKTARFAELAPAEASSGDVAMSDNPDDYPGVPEVIAQGVSKVREGVELGLKLTTAGEEMARIMLNMRSLVPNPDTGLPDITAQRKTTRNFAAKIYAEARKDVTETDVERLGAHNSLVKATQNKMSDVLVDWLNALDSPESFDVVKALYPTAASMVESARQAQQEGEDVSESELRPSNAIRSLYADKGIELPLKGRTELMREHRARKALEAARKERDELLDSEEPGAQEKLEKVDEKIRDLAADLGDAAAPEPEKSDAERAAEAFEKLRKDIDSTRKRLSKLSGADKRKAKGELYTLIRDAAHAFELDLSALVTEESE